MSRPGVQSDPPEAARPPLRPPETRCQLQREESVPLAHRPHVTLYNIVSGTEITRMCVRHGG